MDFTNYFMRFTICIGFALLISSICNAQFSVKINGGISNNHLITDISNQTFTNNVCEIGYSVGFLVKYNFTRIIGLETGICWIQKNYSFKRTENYSGIFDKYTNNYMQIPFTLQIKILEKKKYQIFFNNGIFTSYWAHAKVNGITPNSFNTTNQLNIDGQCVQSFYLTTYSNKYDFNTTKDNRFEFGLQTGIVLQYSIKKETGFFLEYRFLQSLTDIQKKYMTNQTSKINQTSLISVGFLLKFNAKNKRSLL